jgi:hypothetical protein
MDIQRTGVRLTKVRPRWAVGKARLRPSGQQAVALGVVLLRSREAAMRALRENMLVVVVGVQSARNTMQMDSRVLRRGMPKMRRGRGVSNVSSRARKAEDSISQLAGYNMDLATTEGLQLKA